MVKFVIKFKDGSYWRAYKLITTDVQEAWSFNKEGRANEQGTRIGLADFTVVPVKLTFKPYKVEEVHAE